jgi:ABC-type cobalamin transport system permease subunit
MRLAARASFRRENISCWKLSIPQDLSGVVVGMAAATGAALLATAGAVAAVPGEAAATEAVLAAAVADRDESLPPQAVKQAAIGSRAAKVMRFKGVLLQRAVESPSCADSGGDTRLQDIALVQ